MEADPFLGVYLPGFVFHLAEYMYTTLIYYLCATTAHHQHRERCDSPPHPKVTLKDAWPRFTAPYRNRTVVVVVVYAV